MSAQVSPLLPSQGIETDKDTDKSKLELTITPSDQTNVSNTANEPTNSPQSGTIQQAILIDDNIDINLLEAPAAGQPESSTQNTPNSDNLSSVSVIENSDSQIEFHSSNTGATQTLTSSEIELHALNTETISASNEINNESSSLFTTEENTQLNNIPESLGRSHGNTTEDFKISIQGQADTNFQFKADTHDTNYGSIHYNEQGEWHYQLDNQSDAVQSLGAGDFLTDSIQLISKSGASYSLDITINGTNDQAILSGNKIEDIQTFSNTEQQAIEENDGTVLVETSGQLSIQDNDAGEARFVSDIDIPSTYGNASITALGEWHYTLHHDLSAIKGLVSGEHLTDHFAIKTLDGSSQLIQITINGTDDAPFLGGGNLANLELSLTSEVEGVLTINDPDFGQSHFQAESSIQTNYGVGSINENGHWRYQVDSSNTEIQTLAEGERRIDTFSVHTADGTEQVIIIPIGNNTFTAENSSSPTQMATETDSIQLNDLLIDTGKESELDSLLQTSFGNLTSDASSSTLSAEPMPLNDVGLAIGNTESDLFQQLIQQGNTDII